MSLGQKLNSFADISVLQVVESEPRMGADFCFNVYDGKRALMVAASSQTEKLQWMEDIVETVQVLLLLFLFYYYYYYFSFIMGTVWCFQNNNLSNNNFYETDVAQFILVFI